MLHFRYPLRFPRAGTAFSIVAATALLATGILTARPVHAQTFLVGANFGSGDINAYDPNTGAFVQTLTNIIGSHDVILGPDGNLYIVSTTGTVTRYIFNSPATLAGTSSTLLSGLNTPTYEAFGTANNLFVSTGTGVNEYSLTGTLLNTYAGTGNSYARGVATSNGFLYAAYEQSSTIRRYTIGAPGTFVDFTGLASAPQDIAVSGSTLFVSSYNANNLTRYTDTGASLTTQQVYSSSISLARGVLLDGTGNVFVGAAGSIVKGSTAGSTVATLATSNTNNVGGLTLVTRVATSAPEPNAAAFALIGLGLPALGIVRRRTRRTA